MGKQSGMQVIGTAAKRLVCLWLENALDIIMRGVDVSYFFNSSKHAAKGTEQWQSCLFFCS